MRFWLPRRPHQIRCHRTPRGVLVDWSTGRMSYFLLRERFCFGKLSSFSEKVAPPAQIAYISIECAVSGGAFPAVVLGPRHRRHGTGINVRRHWRPCRAELQTQLGACSVSKIDGKRSTEPLCSRGRPLCAFGGFLPSSHSHRPAPPRPGLSTSYAYQFFHIQRRSTVIL